MNNYRDNLEIDLKDLVFFILKKWKQLLLGAIVGAVILTVCGSVHQGQRQQDDTQIPNLKTISDADVNSAIMNMTIKEKADVDLAYKAYQQCVELYNQLEKNDENERVEDRIELIKATSEIVAIGSTSGFTSDQKTYFASLFGNEDSISAIKQSEEIMVEPSSMNVLKQVFLGALLGLLAIMCFFALKYIFTPVLKTEDDLRISFKLPIIGKLDPKSDNTFALIYSGISACARKAGAHKIIFLTDNVEETKTCCENISNMFLGKDILVKVGGNILINPLSIEEITKFDGVILFEKRGKSRYDDIAREIELCGYYGVPVIGTVMIE